MLAWKDEKIITEEQYQLLENRYNPRPQKKQKIKVKQVKTYCF
jgi:hypothetical protein